MTTEKLEQKTEKSAENSYTNKNSLEMFKSLFDGSQEQPIKNHPTPYSKDDSLKYYRSSFYSLFV